MTWRWIPGLLLLTWVASYDATFSAVRADDEAVPAAMASGPGARPGSTATDASPGEPALEPLASGPGDTPASRTPTDDPPPGTVPDAVDAGGAPGADDEKRDERRFDIQADKARIEDGVTLTEGNVKVQGSEFEVASDAALIDADQIWVRFSGNVTIGSQNMQTSAASLDINLETSKWRAQQARTVIDPSFFEAAEVAEALYLRAKTIQTPADRDIVEAMECSVTSCNKPHPHYHLHTRHAKAVPGKKVVLDKPSVYLFGTRIFRYPFDLVLSLETKENKFIPEIGENQVEGKYAKFAYSYAMDDENSGLLRLHLTEKRGTGYGFDHWLDTSRHSGELALFYEPSEGALTSRLNHRWAMSREYAWDLRSSFQRNSGYYGTTETISNDWSLTRRAKSVDSSLGFRQSISTSSDQKSTRLSTAYTHRQRLGVNSEWNLRATMRDTKSKSGQPTDEELETSFEYRTRQKRYDLNFLVDKRYDLDGSRYTGDSTYRALNRLPQITLKTDTDRLDGWRPFGRISTRGELEMARYEQDPEGLSVSRLATRFDFGGSRQQLSRDATLRTSARYYQSFYDDGSAAYVLAANSDLRVEGSDGWTSRLLLSYSKPDGFSPIRLDYWGRNKNVRFQLGRLEPNKSRLDLSTGRDFVSDQWQAALAKYEVMTSSSSKLSLDTGYDIERSEWRMLQSRWTFAHPRRLRVSLGAQYDLDESDFRQGTIDVDWYVDRKTQLEFQGRYSGSTNKLDQMDVRLTRDLHCWLGSIAYSKPTGDWQINIGLKAFPAVQTNFGSTHGSSFQSGAGVYY